MRQTPDGERNRYQAIAEGEIGSYRAAMGDAESAAKGMNRGGDPVSLGIIVGCFPGCQVLEIAAKLAR
jgi:hypothetical protein